MRVSLGTYRLFFEAGAEESLVCSWGEDEERALRRRAAGRRMNGTTTGGRRKKIETKTCCCRDGEDRTSDAGKEGRKEKDKNGG